MYWILVFLSLCTAFYLYSMKHYKYWTRKGVKQSFAFPPLGDQFESIIKAQALHEMVTSLYNRFPEARYSGIYQFNRPILMLRDPQLIKQLCVKDSEYFLDHRPFLPKDSDPMWEKNLLSLTGQKWKNMRATLSPSFTGSKMRQMYALMHNCAENFVHYLSQGSEDVLEIELKDAFARYTNDIIATTAFGIQCNSLKNRENEFFVNGKKTTDFTGVWKNLKFMMVLIMPSLGRILRVSIFDREVTKFFMKIIKETLEYREKNNIDRPDMISLLMHARKATDDSDALNKKGENNFAAVEEPLVPKLQPKEKMDLSLDDITAQALTFFFAGFDAVSTTMCFVAYELALNPDIQNKLLGELDEFRARSDTLTYEGLSKLPYLDMVVSETLRKWPTNFATDRKCVKPYTIKPEQPDENPVDLTEIDTLWIPIWAIQHDPKYWENPEKFDPDRFSPENKDKIIPYTYLPFGVGPRNCIGSRFALIEVKAVFYGLLAHFEIVPTKKSTIPFVPSKRAFNLSSANGFWFGLKRRKVTEL